MGREMMGMRKKRSRRVTCYLLPRRFTRLRHVMSKRLCHLTNKIYREILFISRQPRDERMIITKHGLRVDPKHVQVSPFSWTPQHRTVLSWNLLAWISVEGKIPSSFTNFITTPELSGPLYISLGFYHSQITEYSLQKIDKWASSFLSIPNIPLIVLWDPPPFAIAFSIRTGVWGNTFPVALFQLKWFLIYSDQLVQNALPVFMHTSLQNCCLVRWR